MQKRTEMSPLPRSNVGQDVFLLLSSTSTRLLRLKMENLRGGENSSVLLLDLCQAARCEETGNVSAVSSVAVIQRKSMIYLQKTLGPRCSDPR